MWTASPGGEATVRGYRRLPQVTAGYRRLPQVNLGIPVRFHRLILPSYTPTHGSYHTPAHRLSWHPPTHPHTRRKIHLCVGVCGCGNELAYPPSTHRHIRRKIDDPVDFPSTLDLKNMVHFQGENGDVNTVYDLFGGQSVCVCVCVCGANLVRFQDGIGDVNTVYDLLGGQCVVCVGGGRYSYLTTSVHTHTHTRTVVHHMGDLGSGHYTARAMDCEPSQSGRQ